MSVSNVDILGVTLAGLGALGAICTAIFQRYRRKTSAHKPEDRSRPRADDFEATRARMEELRREIDAFQLEAFQPSMGVLSTTADPVVTGNSAEAVDESPTLTAAMQSADVINLVIHRQLHQNRSAAGEILGTNAALQLISAREAKEAIRA